MFRPHLSMAEKLPQVLVLRPSVALAGLQTRLSQRFHLLKAWESPLPTADFLETHAASVEVVLCTGGTFITADILRRLPSLQLIVSITVGLDRVDLPECRRRRISITNAGETFSPDCADMAVGLLIDVLRKMSAADRFVRAGHWPTGGGDFPLGSRLGGKRVGVVGLGSIGLQVAKRLQAFGCIILYNSRRKKENIPYPFYSNVCELAADSDVLLICCPLTDETRHMINKEVMKALGKNGVIINVGRGAIIDEKQLVQCLVQGVIAGAGLDVFENEPNVPEELLALDNVVLTPHGAVCTPESFSDLYDLVVGNLEAFFANKPLLSPVLDE